MTLRDLAAPRLDTDLGRRRDAFLGLLQLDLLEGRALGALGDETYSPDNARPSLTLRFAVEAALLCETGATA